MDFQPIIEKGKQLCFFFRLFSFLFWGGGGGGFGEKGKKGEKILGKSALGVPY